MKTVSSSEFAGQISNYTEMANHEPVVIYDPGMPALALIPASVLYEFMLAIPQSDEQLGDDPFFDVMKRHVALPANTEETSMAICRLFQRIITCTPIDGSRFELGGYVFRVEDGVALVESTCDWILKPKSEVGWFIAALRKKMVNQAAFEFRPWIETPNSGSVLCLGFVPALIGLEGRVGMTARYIAELLNKWKKPASIREEMFYDLEIVALSILRKNICDVEAFFPHLDRDAFIRDFFPDPKKW